MSSYFQFGMPEDYLDAYNEVKYLIDDYSSKIPQSNKNVPYIKGKLTQKQKKRRNKSKSARRKQR
jgi:hypothetical protein